MSQIRGWIPGVSDLARFDGSFWPGETWDLPGDEGEIGGYRAGRPIADGIFSACARGRPVRYRGMEKPAHECLCCATAYKIAGGAKGQACGNQRLQQHSPLGDPDSAEKGGLGFGAGCGVGEDRSRLSPAQTGNQERPSRVRAGADMGRGGSRERRVQRACQSGGSVSRRATGKNNSRDRADPRGEARYGQELSQGIDSFLLVCPRYAEKL